MRRKAKLSSKTAHCMDLHGEIPITHLFSTNLSSFTEQICKSQQLTDYGSTTVGRLGRPGRPQRRRIEITALTRRELPAPSPQILLFRPPLFVAQIAKKTRYLR